LRTRLADGVARLHAVGLGSRIPAPATMSNHAVVLIVGPTAVGKTEISIQLALRLNGEIISADSRLFYRGMDIGTAKPSLAQRQAIPHHLIDIANPDETVTLASFEQLAHQAISDIQGRGRLPILVGGTGQYVRAVTTGWAPPGVPPDTRLRSILEDLASQRGSAWLLGRLAAMDPDAAGAIDHRNVRRTVRALEVILSTGRKFSLQRGRTAAPYRFMMLGLNLPRSVLYARVDERIDRMFEAGLLEETRSLLTAGYAPDLPALSAIGYRECIALIRGELQLDGAKREIKRATRAFVRRQANWFKLSDPRITWFSVDDKNAVDAMEALIVKQLAELHVPGNPAFRIPAATPGPE
jgi:tRNA dimethylallyltransferase